MTMAIGFKCDDGVVVCSDSLESDGFIKGFVAKCKPMGVIQTGSEPTWGVAFAGAGGGGVLDKFVKETNEQLLRCFLETLCTSGDKSN
jgi:20S proteasome alpha/beta subunit